MPKDQEPQRIKLGPPSTRVIANREERMMYGVKWEDQYGDPTEALARYKIGHIDDLSNEEWLDLYLEFSTQFGSKEPRNQKEKAVEPTQNERSH